MDQRRTKQADEQPRLADVFAGERRKQATQPFRDRPPLAQQGLIRVGLHGDHEIEIAELVHGARHVRAADSDADEALVLAEPIDGVPQERRVGLGNPTEAGLTLHRPPFLRFRECGSRSSLVHAFVRMTSANRTCRIPATAFGSQIPRRPNRIPYMNQNA
jgi:hypothetical protein